MSIFQEVGKYSPKYREISILTREGLEGKIDWRSGLEKRIKLLMGLDEIYFYKALENIRLRRYAAEVIERLRSIGLVVGVLTGGFNILADEITKRIKLDFIYSNRLIFKNGKLSSVVINVVDKGMLLRNLAEKYNIKLIYTVAVVDGANDITLAKTVGFSIGFKPKEILKKYVNIIVEDDLRRVEKYILEYFSRLKV